MSTSQWKKEPGSGRYYTTYEDRYGSPFRVYEDELDTQSSHRSQYRGHHHRETPRRFEETGQTQPIAISKASSKYRKDDGYGKPRDERTYERRDDRTYEREDEYGSPSNPRGSETAGRSYGALQPLDDLGSRRRRKSSADDPLPAMGNLTLDEVVGSPGYAAVSSSAPTPQSQWEPRPRTHEDSSTIIYEESTGYSAVPSIVPAYTTAYDEKGKGIATEGPVSYPPGNQDSRVISGTDGDTEPLDPSYAVRRKDWKSFFRQGRVFSTLWTDAFADITNESEYNQFPSVVSYRVAYNERVHSKIRRFVVVKFGDRYCTCLPVTTYNRRGYRKGGIDLNEHGLIYSDKREPASIRGIKKKALKVSLSPGADKLINPSYINYGRVYTVETNVKVKDVGELNSDSRRLLRQYWNECQTVPEDDEGSASVQTHAAVLTGVGSGFTESSQDYMGGPSSALGPFPPSMTSSSAHYGSYAGYRQPGYGHSSGWQNTGYLAQSSQHSYAIPGPTYEPQTGPSHGSGAGNFVYTATQYDMPQRSSASEYPTPIDSRYGQRGSVSARDELPSSGYARDELPSSGYASNISQVYPSNADPHSTHSRFSSHGDSTAPISDDRYQHHDYYSQEGHISAAQASSHEQYPAIVSSGEGQYPPADDSARYSSEAHHSSSRAQDLEYRPYDDDDPSLVMPTLEEVQASRRYRHGSMSGGSRTHTARGREGRGRRR